MIRISGGYSVPWKGLGMMVCAALLLCGAAHGQGRGPGDEHLPPVGPRDPCSLPPGDEAGAPLDPGALGPFNVTTAHYALGTQSYFPLPGEAGVEEIGYVHSPSNLNCGPYPMIFMMHGSHATCYDAHDGFSQNWPCADDETFLENYRGFDYLAHRLASHGFVVVSISANSINANFGAGIWDEARARLFQHHMDLWQVYSTVGGPDLGGQFIGKVNLQRVGTLGHSRGGQAALLQVALNESLGSPYGIRGVFAIGATRNDDTIATGVPIGLLLPYCDGDQEDLPSIRYFDESRYAVPGDPGAKFTFLVDGANHNYYNTNWDPDIFVPGALDDWEDNFPDKDTHCNLDAIHRLDGDRQRGTAIALASAFFRAHLRNERDFLRFLRGDAAPPPSAMTGRIYMGYLPGDDPETRLDVNRLTESDNTAFNTLDGAVSHANLLRFEWCEAQSENCLENLDASPFSGRDGRQPHFNVNQLKLAWAGNDGVFENELPPAYRDVSRYRALQFRALVDSTDGLNPLDQPQDLSIELEDGAGLVASVRASDHSRSLYYPPSDDLPLQADTPLPRGVLNTVRVPLADFDDIFLTDIRAVRLRFDQTNTGAINIADLAFADETLDATPTASCEVAVPSLTASGAKLETVGLEVTASDTKGNPAIAVAVFSDEDDTDSQPSQNSPDAKDIAPGTLRLRGEADKDEDGRVYLIVATATDAGGNTGFGCCTVTVANGNQEADAEAAELQAQAAAAQCTAFAAAAEGLAPVPGGYYEVGDGAVIGPDQ
jgi:hypothetical protein